MGINVRWRRDLFGASWRGGACLKCSRTVEDNWEYVASKSTKCIEDDLAERHCGCVDSIWLAVNSRLLNSLAASS